MPLHNTHHRNKDNKTQHKIQLFILKQLLNLSNELEGIML